MMVWQWGLDLVIRDLEGDVMAAEAVSVGAKLLSLEAKALTILQRVNMALEFDSAMVVNLRRPGGYGCLDFSSPISLSLPLLCGLCSGQSWGAFELLVPPSISCLKHLELLVCSDRACDLLQGGSDRGLLSRSTSSSERWYWSLRIGWFGAAVVFDLGAVAIGFDCSWVERSPSDLVEL
ncbi:hypothetical protein ACOSP7_005297 [Xanthoceras sorbifolium]